MVNNIFTLLAFVLISVEPIVVGTGTLAISIHRRKVFIRIALLALIGFILNAIQTANDVALVGENVG